MKTFHILTLFPDMFNGPFSESILKRAKEKGILDIKFYNLRDYGVGPRKQVDDTPYGGGAGMVLKVDVVDSAIDHIESKIKADKYKIILLTPQGEKLEQKIVKKLADSEITDYILICGHYEGFDERIRKMVDQEISIGDFVLTGGEIPAMVLVDSIVRLLPGVLGKEESHQSESFENNLLEHPHYTRPEEYKGEKVPEVLLSGNHAKIEAWRSIESMKRTKERRRDLLK